MIRALLKKELRQHRLALAALAVLAVTGYLLILGVIAIQGEAGSAFEGLRVFTLVVVPLSAVVLGHRLVVVEYQAKTQLFLEGLPVSRAHLLGVKYLLGLLFLLGLVGVALVSSYVVAGQREALTPRFAALIAARVLSVTWCAYSFFFLMGFLGRYRLALYLAAFLAALAIHQATDLRFDRFGPLALLDDRFPYERDVVPWSGLGATWELSAVFLLLTVVLGLTREGSVAALLAEKMSHREKVFIAALLVGLLCAVSLLDEKKRKAPFDLHDAVTEQRAGVAVKVASAGTEPAEAQQLAQYVCRELVAACDYLGIRRLPPVFITRRGDLDVDRYERGELERAEGVHVQANFQAKAWNREHFLAWLLREVLIARSADRARLEPKMWVLDGFPLFWTQRDHGDAPMAHDPKLALRALYGTQTLPSSRDLGRWLSFREKVGEDIAAAVAWSGLKTMARRQGSERCQRFLRSVLGAEVPKDFRALLHERAAPLEHLLRDAAGVGPDRFLAQWQEDLAVARRAMAGELGRLPRLEGQLHFVPLSADSRTARFRVRIERPPVPDARYSVLYHLLPAFDEEVSPPSIQREEAIYARRPEGDLPETYARGARLYWTFAMDVPAMGCRIISGWKRQEVP